METYCSEFLAQCRAAERDQMTDAAVEREEMIDNGAQWFTVVYLTTFAAGNTERIVDRVLAFSRDEAIGEIVQCDPGAEIVDAMTDIEIAAA